MTTLTERELTHLLRGNPDIAVAGDGYQKIVDAVLGKTQRGEPEHDMQKAIIAKCEELGQRNPLYRLIYAIPNGGDRNVVVGAKLKAEGVRKGMLDLCLPVARHGFHGLYMELKAGKGRLSKEQEGWIDCLTGQGYLVTLVRDDPDEAIRIIEHYLEGEE